MGIFYYTCLSSCPLFISRQLSLALFPSLFSCLTEGCRSLRSGWWSSNSIYSAAQRQTERARAIGSGMETADVREHFLLTAERRGRPHRKLARRRDVWIDSAGDCVCLRACGRGHYRQKQYVCKEKKSRILASEIKDKPFPPLLTRPSAGTQND